MISNSQTLKAASHKLHELDLLPNLFFLTGSRFFRPDTVTSQTDYDFFVEAGPGLVSKLLELGYRPNTEDVLPYTGDRSIKYVLTFRHPPSLKIDIQVVHDAGIKLQAQKLLSGLGVFVRRQERCLEAMFWSRTLEALVPPVDRRTLWERDEVQFPRLLAEISATQDSLDVAALADSMDLSEQEVNELFERADTAWETQKEKTRWTS